jgi:hypothetical protein
MAEPRFGSSRTGVAIPVCHNYRILSFSAKMRRITALISAGPVAFHCAFRPAHTPLAIPFCQKKDCYLFDLASMYWVNDQRRHGTRAGLCRPPVRTGVCNARVPPCQPGLFGGRAASARPSSGRRGDPGRVHHSRAQGGCAGAGHNHSQLAASHGRFCRRRCLEDPVSPRKT